MLGICVRTSVEVAAWEHAPDSAICIDLLVLKQMQRDAPESFASLGAEFERKDSSNSQERIIRFGTMRAQRYTLRLMPALDIECFAPGVCDPSDCSNLSQSAEPEFSFR